MKINLIEGKSRKIHCYGNTITLLLHEVTKTDHFKPQANTKMHYKICSFLSYFQITKVLLSKIKINTTNTDLKYLTSELMKSKINMIYSNR